jgi:ParB-like chromosome segregation protein Spo0J
MTAYEDRPGVNRGDQEAGRPTDRVPPGSDIAREAAAPFQVMPPLSVEEYEALRDDIAAHGVRVPIDIDQYGRILDGHHRAQVCAELGTIVPTRVVIFADETAAREHAYATNTARRHLSRELRRAVVTRSLLADPGLSDRAHANRCGVSPTTVGTVRAVLVESGQVSNLDSRTGADGRERPATQTSARAKAERNVELIRDYRDHLMQGVARVMADVIAAGEDPQGVAACVRAELDQWCAELEPWPFDERPSHEDLLRSWVEGAIEAVLAESVPA